MFPCMISRAATIDVLSSGTGVTRDNELQVVYFSSICLYIFCCLAGPYEKAYFADGC